MAVTNGKEPACSRPAKARHRSSAGWLAAVLVSGVVGCAGLEQNHLLQPLPPSPIVLDQPIKTPQPVDSESFEIVVQVRRVPDPPANQALSTTPLNAIASARALVHPTSFQAPNIETRAIPHANPGQTLQPIQPGPLTPIAARSPSDQLAEPTQPGTSNSDEESESIPGFPIDLPTALRLAGANNLHIALAAERVEQALAKAQASRAKWLPSLNAGVSYNKHDGRIQSTEGTVSEANRGSLFVGGGVGLGGAPLNGGSGGPPRLFVDMSVADLLFEPLAARQTVDAAAASQSAVFNERVLEAAIAYQRLVYAQAMIAIRAEAVENATRLLYITTSFADAGEGFPADAERARAELARRQGELLESEEAVDDASTSLALVLRLDPATRLVPTDTDVVPVDLFNQGQPLDSLIAQAIAARPDLASAELLVNATSTRAELEHWRPWLPHVYLGYSGGGFGGNENSDLKAFGGRGDFDVAAVWQLENFGFGNAARRRSTESLHRQAHLEVEQLRDRIAGEVTTAFHRSNSRRKQIDVAAPRITAASTSLELNFTSIRGGVLRPIEPQQAIGALADARASYLNSLMRYNAAQLQLLYAIGLPPNLPEDGSGIPEDRESAQAEAVPPPVDN